MRSEIGRSTRLNQALAGSNRPCRPKYEFLVATMARRCLLDKPDMNLEITPRSHVLVLNDRAILKEETMRRLVLAFGTASALLAGTISGEVRAAPASTSGGFQSALGDISLVENV